MMGWDMRKQSKSIPPAIILRELLTRAVMALRLVGSRIIIVNRKTE
jgi:hypothetical protein